MSSTLTMLEFSTDEDFATAEHLCRKLGYVDSWAYTASSYVPGLYCLPMRPTQTQKIVVKTAELGFIVIEETEE